jgi:hypothetical protein
MGLIKPAPYSQKQQIPTFHFICQLQPEIGVDTTFDVDPLAVLLTRYLAALDKRDWFNAA